MRIVVCTEILNQFTVIRICLLCFYQNVVVGLFKSLLLYGTFRNFLVCYLEINIVLLGW